MNDIPKAEKKSVKFESKIIAILSITLLASCTTLTHQVTSQYNAVKLALAHERAIHSQQDSAVSDLAHQAQLALCQPAGIPIANQDLAKIQNILAPNNKPVIGAQKRTDAALAHLDHTTVKAAKLAVQEQKDSSFFGIPGLIHHGLQVISSAAYFFIAAVLLAAALYIASFFFPVMGPIFAISESLAGSAISILSRLRR